MLFRYEGRVGMGLIKTFVMAVLFLPVIAGCATQADLVDVETSMEKGSSQLGEIQSRLTVVEDYFKERSTTVQRGQADLAIRLEQISADLQAAQGKLEETVHLLAELSRRADDQGFRGKELTERLDYLDTQVSSLGKSLGVKTGKSSANKQGEKLAGGTLSPSGQGVVLPGRVGGGSASASGISPSEAYGLAYNDYLKGNYVLALMGFENFLVNFKTTSLAPNAQYWIGESLYGKKDYILAIVAFEKVIRDYPENNKVPGALLKAGYALIKIGDKAKARKYLKKVVEKYPLSNEGKLAKSKLADIT